MLIIPTTPPALSFTVFGLPGPQGSKKFVGLSKRGHGVLVESSKKVQPWRAAVARAAREAQGQGWVPLDGPLLLVVEFYMPRPKGHPKTIRTLPATTPDLSKLLRATEDALTTAGTYADDGRIVDHVIRERYATDISRVRLAHELEVPGARIAVWSVSPLETMGETALIVGASLPAKALGGTEW